MLKEHKDNIFKLDNSDEESNKKVLFDIDEEDKANNNFENENKIKQYAYNNINIKNTDFEANIHKTKYIKQQTRKSQLKSTDLSALSRSSAFFSNTFVNDSGIFGMYGELNSNFNPMEMLVSYSLNMFSRDSQLRIKLVKITLSRWFVNLMITFIMLNSLFLIFDTIDSLNYIYTYTNYFFVFVFAIECIIKVIAFGFSQGNHTYIQDNWNKLDFVIVCFSFLDLMPFFSANILVIRMLRLFRPLKTMSLLPSMKKFITTLLNSLIDLSSVFLMMLFFYIIFSLFGLLLWSEAFTYRCRVYNYPKNGILPPDTNYPTLCGGSNDCGGDISKCVSLSTVYYQGYFFIDPRNQTDLFRDDLYISDLNYGLTTFDNFGKAIYVVFQVATMEAWTNIMYKIMAGQDYTVTLVYFLLLILIISYFILNLTVAVMLYNFQKYNDESENEKPKKRIKQKKDFSTLVSQNMQMSVNQLGINTKKSSSANLVSNVNLIEKSNFNNNNNSKEVNFVNSIDVKDNQESYNKSFTANKQLSNTNNAFSTSKKKTGNTSKVSFSKSLNSSTLRARTILNEEDNQDKREMRRNYNSILRTNSSSVKKMKFILSKFNKTEFIKTVKPISNYQKENPIAFVSYAIYSQPVVQYFIYLVIISNIIILTLERSGRSQWEIDLTETINLACVFIFVFECTIMLIGYGIRVYFRDFWNWNDFIVTTLSVVDISIGTLSGGDSKTNSSSVVSVFRILRILRLFKLVRNWQSFQIIIISLRETLIRMFDYSIIFIIFVYIYSLLGYQIFAKGLSFSIIDNEYNSDPTISINNTYNFDTFYNSALSVFAIIIGNAWSNFFYDCLRSTYVSTPTAYFYYVTLVLFGRITLLNIFLAYLIDNFQSARKFLKKNIRVKDYIDNIYFSMSQIHDQEIIEYNNMKKYETSKQVNKYALKLEHKELVSEGKFLIYAKNELNFNKVESRITRYDNKSDDKNIFNFDMFFGELEMRRRDGILELENFYENSELKVLERSIIRNNKESIKNISYQTNSYSRIKDSVNDSILDSKSYFNVTAINNNKKFAQRKEGSSKYFDIDNNNDNENDNENDYSNKNISVVSKHSKQSYSYTKQDRQSNSNLNVSRKSSSNVITNKRIKLVKIKQQPEKEYDYSIDTINQSSKKIKPHHRRLPSQSQKEAFHVRLEDIKLGEQDERESQITESEVKNKSTANILKRKMTLPERYVLMQHKLNEARKKREESVEALRQKSSVVVSKKKIKETDVSSKMSSANKELFRVMNPIEEATEVDYTVNNIGNKFTLFDFILANLHPNSLPRNAIKRSHSFNNTVTEDSLPFIFNKMLKKKSIYHTRNLSFIITDRKNNLNNNNKEKQSLFENVDSIYNLNNTDNLDNSEREKNKETDSNNITNPSNNHNEKDIDHINNKNNADFLKLNLHSKHKSQFVFNKQPTLKLDDLDINLNTDLDFYEFKDFKLETEENANKRIETETEDNFSHLINKDNLSHHNNERESFNFRSKNKGSTSSKQTGIALERNETLLRLHDELSKHKKETQNIDVRKSKTSKNTVTDTNKNFGNNLNMLIKYDMTNQIPEVLHSTRAMKKVKKDAHEKINVLKKLLYDQSKKLISEGSDDKEDKRTFKSNISESGFLSQRKLTKNTDSRKASVDNRLSSGSRLTPVTNVLRKNDNKGKKDNKYHFHLNIPNLDLQNLKNTSRSKDVPTSKRRRKSKLVINHNNNRIEIDDYNKDTKSNENSNNLYTSTKSNNKKVNFLSSKEIPTLCNTARNNQSNNKDIININDFIKIDDKQAQLPFHSRAQSHEKPDTKFSSTPIRTMKKDIKLTQKLIEYDIININSSNKNKRFNPFNIYNENLNDHTPDSSNNNNKLKSSKKKLPLIKAPDNNSQILLSPQFKHQKTNSKTENLCLPSHKKPMNKLNRFLDIPDTQHSKKRSVLSKDFTGKIEETLGVPLFNMNNKKINSSKNIIDNIRESESSGNNNINISTNHNLLPNLVKKDKNANKMSYKLKINNKTKENYTEPDVNPSSILEILKLDNRNSNNTHNNNNHNFQKYINTESDTNEVTAMVKAINNIKQNKEDNEKFNNILKSVRENKLEIAKNKNNNNNNNMLNIPQQRRSFLNKKNDITERTERTDKSETNNYPGKLTHRSNHRDNLDIDNLGLITLHNNDHSFNHNNNDIFKYKSDSINNINKDNKPIDTSAKQTNGNNSENNNYNAEMIFSNKNNTTNKTINVNQDIKDNNYNFNIGNEINESNDISDKTDNSKYDDESDKDMIQKESIVKAPTFNYLCGIKFKRVWKYMKESSFCIFHVNNFIRKFCVILCTHILFEYFIVLIIILNCISIILDSPWNDPDSNLAKYIKYSNYVFSVVFFLECIIKIISFGFLFRYTESVNRASLFNEAKLNEFLKSNLEEEDYLNYLEEKLIITKEKREHLINLANTRMKSRSAYIRELGNILDFSIVVLSMVELSYEFGDNSNKVTFSYLKTFRALKSLRPIRILTKNENLKIILDCIVKSVPALGKILLATGTFIFIYSIVGINLFIDDISYYCKNSTIYFDVKENTNYKDPYKYNYYYDSNFSFLTDDQINDSSRLLLNRIYEDQYDCLLKDYERYMFYNNTSYNYLNSSYSKRYLQSGNDSGNSSNDTFSISIVSSSKIILNRAALNLVTEDECLQYDGYWVYYYSNFNNILQALRTLFELMTSEGWLSIMNRAASSKENKWVYLYFTSYMLVGFFFILNLMISVVIDKFKSLKEKALFYSKLTEEEQEWFRLQKIMLKYKPKPKLESLTDNSSSFKRSLFSVITHKYFERIVGVVILLSTIPLILTFKGQSDQFSNITDYVNYGFAFLFNLEMLMKIFVFRSIYFQTGWNIFDFTVIIVTNFTIAYTVFDKLGYFSSSDNEVIYSSNRTDYYNVTDGTSFYITDNSEEVIASLLKSAGGGSNNYSQINFIRTLRIIRILRLLAVNNSMRSLVDTLVYIIPTVLNIGLVLFIVILIYASIGVQFFSTVPFRETIDQYNNFKHFGNSALLLFRTITGEAWNDIMNEISFHNCKKELVFTDEYTYDYYCMTYNQVFCVEDSMVNYTSLNDLGYRSCGNSFSFIYIISYQILSPIIVMNLFVVIVIEGFSDSMYENESMLCQDNMDEFINIWMNYDPKCSKIVRPHEFVLILKELKPPIGLNYDRFYIEQAREKLTNRKKFMKYKKHLLKNLRSTETVAIIKKGRKEELLVNNKTKNFNKLDNGDVIVLTTGHTESVLNKGGETDRANNSLKNDLASSKNTKDDRDSSVPLNVVSLNNNYSRQMSKNSEMINDNATNTVSENNYKKKLSNTFDKNIVLFNKIKKTKSLNEKELNELDNILIKSDSVKNNNNDINFKSQLSISNKISTNDLKLKRRRSSVNDTLLKKNSKRFGLTTNLINSKKEEHEERLDKYKTTNINKIVSDYEHTQRISLRSKSAYDKIKQSEMNARVTSNLNRIDSKDSGEFYEDNILSTNRPFIKPLRLNHLNTNDDNNNEINDNNNQEGKYK